MTRAICYALFGMLAAWAFYTVLVHSLPRGYFDRDFYFGAALFFLLPSALGWLGWNRRQKSE